MNYYRPENGHSGPPPHWPQPASHPNGNGAGKPGTFDLLKGSLNITVVGTVLYAALTIGMAVGAYQERGAHMAAQLARLEVSMKGIEERLPKIEAALDKIKDQPRWTMHVEGKR